MAPSPVKVVVTSLEYVSKFAVPVAVAVALMLTLVPLPLWAEVLRPEWVTLVLIYWCIALPQRIGVFTGWLAGLMLDVARGALQANTPWPLPWWP